MSPMLIIKRAFVTRVVIGLHFSRGPTWPERAMRNLLLGRIDLAFFLSQKLVFFLL
jgi:hypothetical protein